jgi:iron complex outermembrane recepter protein
MFRYFISASALLLLLAPSALVAQTPANGRVEGRVIDAETRQPLPGVMVHVEDPRRHEITHDDGTFHLAQLPPGTYTLLIEMVGYGTRSVPVSLAAGAVAQVDIELTPAPVEIEGVVVTATVAGRSADDALRPTSVVSGRDLQRQMDASIAGTLESEAGVAVASMGPAPARPVIRGLGGDRVLILEDGERMGDVSASSPDHAVSMDPLAAERIEVVRGPAALFYGSNALGGVVNVITEEIPTTLPDRIHGGFTLQGRSATEGVAGEGSITAPLGARFAMRSGLSMRRAGDLETPVGVVDNTQLTSTTGSIGAAFVNGWGHAGVSVRGFETEYGIPSDTAAGQEEGVTLSMERLAARGQLHWTRSAGPFDHIEVDAKATRLENNEIEATGEVGTRIDLDTYALEVTARHSGIAFFDRGAVGVRTQLADYDALREGSEPLAVDEWDGAVYALEELEADRFQFQTGARVDFARRTPTRAPAEVQSIAVSERSFASLSGSVSGLYRLGDAARLGVAFTRAFRTPSSDELFSEGSHLATYTFEAGNPELEAEIGHGLDVFLRLEQSALRGEVAAFWNRIDDYVYPRNTGEVDAESNLFVYRATNTDAQFRGAEASLRWSPLANVALDGSLSWVVAENLTLDEPLPFIPPLQGDLAVRYERTSWFSQIGWQGAARQDRLPARPPLVGGYCDENGGLDGCRRAAGEFLETEGYGIWSASAGYRWFMGGALNSVTLTVENLTDDVYRNHLSRIKELLPEQGRSINLIYRTTF